MSDDYSTKIQELQDLSEYLVKKGLLLNNVDDLNEFLYTPEYTILSAVLMNHSSIQAIQNQFDANTYFSLVLSKLESQGIIKRQGDQIFLDFDASKFRKAAPLEKKPTEVTEVSSMNQTTSTHTARRDRMLKEMASQAQDMESESTQINIEVQPTSSSKDMELDSLFDDLDAGETLEDVLGDLKALEGSKTTSSVIKPLVDLLREFNYINTGQPEIEAENNSAYKILKTILNQHPISSEDIGKATKIDESLSMLLSNLTADRLIEQTNDYRYTLSKAALKKLKQYLVDHTGGDSSDPELDLLKSHISNHLQQFKEALIHVGYITQIDQTIESYKDKPEVGILYTIISHPGYTSDEIKDVTPDVMPVVVMQQLSKLNADGLTEPGPEGIWLPSNKLFYLMAKSKLKTSLSEDHFDALAIKFD